MATSSLLLLRRCLWYRHGRWRTSSSMTLLRHYDRRFATTFVVSSQDYIEDSASADDIKIFFTAYVRRITDKRLLWRCHHSIPTIYMYSCLRCTSLANVALPIHLKRSCIICIKNIEFYHPPTMNHNVHTNYPLLQYTTPNDTYNTIYMIYVQHSWIWIPRKVWYGNGGYIIGLVCT